MKKAFSLLLVLSLVLCSALAMAESAENDKDFVLTLTANPTTGYTWQYVLSEDGIVTVEEDFLSASDIDKIAGVEPAPLCGEGGLSLFTVKGVKAGEVILALEYSQSWEKDDPEAGRTYTLRVGDDLSVVCLASTVGLDD